MKRTIAALALAASASPALAQQTEDQCRALRDTVIDGAAVTSARVIGAEGTLPAYCEVRATARPAISIEVRLPLDGWNGGFYQAGCGGYCGILGRADASGGWVNAMRPGLERGYATATSDSGHHALGVTEGLWAYNNPQAERDWGWRSIPETNRVGGALVQAFYGSGSERSIFQGCSTGGRMAHVAALRFPEMFDGIISGAPAMDYTGLVATKMAWLVQANTARDGSQVITHDTVPLIASTVMEQCDGVDGTQDGLIADPRQCDVDLTGLTCNSDSATDCLTSAQQSTLARWRQGPVNAAGDQLYPGGIPEGSESFWWLWLTGNADGAGRLVPAFVTDFGRYMAFAQDPGPEWTPMDFDFGRDPARLKVMAEVYNGDDPDISAFRAAGGRMIVYHGWADSIVTPYKTVEWFEQAAELAGGKETLEENVALFMVPGMDHCGILPGAGGIGAASLDPTAAMERWLDSGTPPTSIMAD